MKCAQQAASAPPCQPLVGARNKAICLRIYPRSRVRLISIHPTSTARGGPDRKAAENRQKQSNFDK
ncbi:hypothetical protein NY78_3955 [Desulfovibrio sp. TomC]|nr:hypothetical protein NY78_3955 [Desulfovibrio sp. TomC]